MISMLLLPFDPLKSNDVDPVFQKDVSAFSSNQLKLFGLNSLRFGLINHDEIENGNIKKGIKRIQKSDSLIYTIYRGWMINVKSYIRFYNELVNCNIQLITNPIEYKACHWLPMSYSYFSKWMPRTAWTSLEDMLDDSLNDTQLRTILESFGSNPIIIKDFVKSQAAGYWDEACFIPNASDYLHAKKVIQRFKDLQGNSLAGGLVLRSYHSLRKSNDEIVEWRAFFFNRYILGCWPRHKIATNNGPPAQLLEEIAQIIPSKFATADFAQLENGDWIMIETGDGKVSSFPDQVDLKEVFLNMITISKNTCM